MRLARDSMLGYAVLVQLRLRSSYFDAISFGSRLEPWIMIPDDGNGVR